MKHETSRKLVSSLSLFLFISDKLYCFILASVPATASHMEVPKYRGGWETRRADGIFDEYLSHFAMELPCFGSSKTDLHLKATEIYFAVELVIYVIRSLFYKIWVDEVVSRNTNSSNESAQYKNGNSSFL